MSDPKPSFVEQVAALDVMNPSTAAPQVTEPASTETPADAPPVEPTKAEPEKPGAASKNVEAQLRRERQLHAESQKLKAERAQWEKDRATDQQKVQAYEAFKARLLQDPAGALKSIGLDKGHVDIATALWAGEAGEEAPRAVQEKRLQAEIARHNAAWEERFQKLEQERAAERQQFQSAQQQAAALEYIQREAAALPETMPHVRALQESDPRGLAAMLYQRAMAKREAGELEGATVADIAAEIEAQEAERLKPYAKLYSSTKNPPPPADKTQPAPRTLNPSNTTLTPPRERPMTRKERLEETVRAMDRGEHLK